MAVDHHQIDAPMYINPKSGDVKCRRFTMDVAAVDIVSGLLAPVAPACLIAIVDCSIIKSLTGDVKVPIKEGMKQGLKDLIRNPLQFYVTKGDWRYLTGLCWMVYAGTYIAVNLCTSYCQANEIEGAQYDMMKLASSFIANAGLTVIKDASIVKHFYKGQKKQVPLFSKGLFVVRDAITMMAAFVVADRMARWLHESTQCSYWACRQFCTYSIPVALQTVSTVIHLWALSYADAPGSFKALLPTISDKYNLATMSRMCRIFPAIGIGSNSNNEFRYRLHKWRHGL